MQSMELTDKNDFGEGCHICNMCPPSKHFYILTLSSKKKYAFLPPREMQKGGHCPFSHKLKFM